MVELKLSKTHLMCVCVCFFSTLYFSLSLFRKCSISNRSNVFFWLFLHAHRKIHMNETFMKVIFSVFFSPLNIYFCFVWIVRMCVHCPLYGHFMSPSAKRSDIDVRYVSMANNSRTTIVVVLTSVFFFSSVICHWNGVYWNIICLNRFFFFFLYCGVEQELEILSPLLCLLTAITTFDTYLNRSSAKNAKDTNSPARITKPKKNKLFICDSWSCFPYPSHWIKSIFDERQTTNGERIV